MIVNKDMKEKMPAYVVFRCMDTTKELFSVNYIDPDKPVIIRLENDVNKAPIDDLPPFEPVANLKYKTELNKQKFYDDRLEKQRKELSRPTKAVNQDV